MKKTIIAITLVLLASCGKPPPRATLYEVEEVTRDTLEVSVGSSGILEPLATVEVKSKASGEVLELLVDTGDYVMEGDLMVRIDPRTVRNRVAQAEAQLKAAEARRDIWRTQVDRAKTLIAKGTLTQTDYEQAALELANAEAQVVSSRVEVENARIALDDTDIRAPIAGTVIEKPVEKGQVISSPTQDFAGGTLLLTMADLAAVQIRAMVDETDIGKIEPGMPSHVNVAAYPNQPFSGEVLKIEPKGVLEQNVTMFAVLVSIQNPHGLLKPGMNAEVEISIALREDVLTIPVMALRTQRDLSTTAELIGIEVRDLRAQLAEGDRGIETPQPASAVPQSDYHFGGTFWVVLVEAHGPRATNLRTGITDLERVEIVSGLDESDLVLILPSAHLVETQQQLQEFTNRRAGGVPGIGGR